MSPYLLAGKNAQLRQRDESKLPYFSKEEKEGKPLAGEGKKSRERKRLSRGLSA